MVQALNGSVATSNTSTYFTGLSRAAFSSLAIHSGCFTAVASGRVRKSGLCFAFAFFVISVVVDPCPLKETGKPFGVDAPPNIE